MKNLIYKQSLLDPIPIGITDGTITLKVARSSQVDKLVRKHHYSKKATVNRFMSFTVNKNMGFLQLGYGIHPRIKQTISTLITKNNYCEFDRMWLSDDLPKFSESRTIALLLSFLKQTHPEIHFVITYADESVGNTGIIYKATNAFRLGSTPVDFYILPNGERIHPISIWHKLGTRKWEIVKKRWPGIIKIKNKRQFRFLYVLNRKTRKLYLKEKNNAKRK